MSTKVLITGGAGFIGSHLAGKYLRQGSEVYVIDNLSTGSLENVKHLQNNPQWKNKFFVVIDTIFNEKKLKQLVAKCDIVIHLAASVGVKYILEHPLTSFDTNVKGAELVLRACDELGKKVFIASSSEVYGKQNKALLKEADDSILGASVKARWGYAASKLLDEILALAYFKTKGLPVVIARFFNTVGPRQTGRYGMVIPRFIQQALNVKALTVYGDGNQTRTFAHVEEVCDCVIRLMETDKAVGRVINIGGTQEVSIKELAKKIIQKTNSNSRIKFIPYKKVYTDDFEDMPRRVPSTVKLKSIIGFTPRKNLDEILDDIINYFKNSRGN